MSAAFAAIGLQVVEIGDRYPQQSDLLGTGLCFGQQRSDVLHNYRCAVGRLCDGDASRDGLEIKISDLEGYGPSLGIAFQERIFQITGDAVEDLHHATCIIDVLG